jgi:hypothetical protein
MEIATTLVEGVSALKLAKCLEHKGLVTTLAAERNSGSSVRRFDGPSPLDIKKGPFPGASKRRGVGLGLIGGYELEKSSIFPNFLPSYAFGFGVGRVTTELYSSVLVF